MLSHGAILIADVPLSSLLTQTSFRIIIKPLVESKRFSTAITDLLMHILSIVFCTYFTQYVLGSSEQKFKRYQLNIHFYLALIKFYNGILLNTFKQFHCITV